MDDLEKRAREAWVVWTESHPWEIFCTFTFPTEISAELALKKWHLYVNTLAKELLPARRAKEVGFPWLASIEVTDSGAHIHALLSDVSFTFRELASKWAKISGSTQVDLRKYNSKKGLYYVLKGNDFHISRFFKRKVVD